MNSCALAVRAAASISSMLASGRAYLWGLFGRGGTHIHVCGICSIQVPGSIVRQGFSCMQPCALEHNPGSPQPLLVRAPALLCMHTPPAPPPHLMLSARVALNSRGSCDTRPMCERSQGRLYSRTSRPSMMILPSAGSVEWGV